LLGHPAQPGFVIGISVKPGCGGCWTPRQPGVGLRGAAVLVGSGLNMSGEPFLKACDDERSAAASTTAAQDIRDRTFAHVGERDLVVHRVGSIAPYGHAV